MRRDLLLVREMIDAAEQGPGSRARFPEISWRNPARLRNRVVHGYWSVDIAVLHTTATEQLADFIALLRHAEAVLTADSPPLAGAGDPIPSPDR